MTDHDRALAGLRAALQELPPDLRHDFRNAVVCVRNTSNILNFEGSGGNLSDEVRRELLADLHRAAVVLEDVLLKGLRPRASSAERINET